MVTAFGFRMFMFWEKIDILFYWLLTMPSILPRCLTLLKKYSGNFLFKTIGKWQINFGVGETDSNASKVFSAQSPFEVTMSSKTLWSRWVRNFCEFLDYSCSKDCGFQSWCHVLDGHFSHWFVVKISIVCLNRPKINEKEARVGPFLKRIFLWVAV